MRARSARGVAAARPPARARRWRSPCCVAAALAARVGRELRARRGAGAAVRAAIVAHQRARRPRRADRDRAARRPAACSGQIDVTLEAIVYGAGARRCGARRDPVPRAATPRPSTPTSCCALLRRVSFRSALTAALATRMVPVLGARRPAPAPTRSAAARRRAGRARAGRAARGRPRARSTGRSTSPRRSRCAATAPAAPAAAALARAPWSRHDLAFARVGGRDRCARRRRRGSAGARRSSPYPLAARAGRRGERARARVALLAAARCCRSPTAGGSSRERARASTRVTYTYPGAARRRCATSRSTSSPGEFVVLAGASGSGKSTLLRAAGGLVPHFHGGTLRRDGVAVAGLDTRDARPGRARRRRRARCSRTPRRRS